MGRGAPPAAHRARRSWHTLTSCSCYASALAQIAETNSQTSWRDDGAGWEPPTAGSPGAEALGLARRHSCEWRNTQKGVQSASLQGTAGDIVHRTAENSPSSGTQIRRHVSSLSAACLGPVGSGACWGNGRGHAGAGGPFGGRLRARRGPVGGLAGACWGPAGDLLETCWRTVVARTDMPPPSRPDMPPTGPRHAPTCP